MIHHLDDCSCNTCQTITKEQVEAHLKLSESSRRDFLKKASRLGLALGLGGGLITPVSASALRNNESSAQSEEMFRNKAVKNGKANIVTILHTADIHAQLHTHHEFFIENGKPVYKLRGGYATLKSMINELRSKNPGNTLLVDGGDCFQGGGVA